MHVYARLWMYMKVWWYKIPKIPVFSISASRLYAWRLIMMECHCSVVRRWSESRSKSCTIFISSGWNQAQADVLSFPQPHTFWGGCTLFKFQLVTLATFPVYDVACRLPVSWPLKLNNKRSPFCVYIYYTYNILYVQVAYVHIQDTCNIHAYTYIYMHIRAYTVWFKKLLHTCTYLPILAYTYN